MGIETQNICMYVFIYILYSDDGLYKVSYKLRMTLILDYQKIFLLSLMDYHVVAVVTILFINSEWNRTKTVGFITTQTVFFLFFRESVFKIINDKMVVKSLMEVLSRSSLAFTFYYRKIISIHQFLFAFYR